MFMQPNSNQTLTVTKSDNARFIVQFYETIADQAVLAPNGGQYRYQMKTLIALDAEEAGRLVAEQLGKM